MGEGVWTFSIVAHQRGLAKAQWSVVDTAAWLVKMAILYPMMGSHARFHIDLYSSSISKSNVLVNYSYAVNMSRDHGDSEQVT